MLADMVRAGGGVGVGWGGGLVGQGAGPGQATFFRG